MKLTVTKKLISRYGSLVKKAIESMSLEDIRANLSDVDAVEFDNVVAEMTNRAIAPKN